MQGQYNYATAVSRNPSKLKDSNNKIHHLKYCTYSCTQYALEFEHTGMDRQKELGLPGGLSRLEGRFAQRPKRESPLSAAPWYPSLLFSFAFFFYFQLVFWASVRASESAVERQFRKKENNTKRRKERREKSSFHHPLGVGFPGILWGKKKWTRKGKIFFKDWTEDPYRETYILILLGINQMIARER